ncbi:MAG: DUF512 domain-containing protein [Firmicutes bacterium]|nr:DUF512 domain-containing protein [Bacillota bacterium]
MKSDFINIKKPKLCRNNCVFCFVNQMPKGLRESLYVKDDDYRLSYITGTYITATNLTEKCFSEIFKYRLSPLYLSVHAVDCEVRKKLLGAKIDDKKQTDIKGIIERLVAGGIKINAQIVLIPKINGGEVLVETLNFFVSLSDSLLSAVVVPVGLTKHRYGLFPLEIPTKEEATATVKTVEEFYEKGLNCYCSDEMYSYANLPVKPYEYYGEFDQIENGAGSTALFLHELKEAVEGAEIKPQRALIITGVLGYPVIESAKEILERSFEGLKIDIFKIPNTFFGETVTVTGLVTAHDILKALQGKDLSVYNKVILPCVMLKKFSDVFLDGVTLKQLSKKLKFKLSVSPTTALGLIDTLNL